MKKKFCLIALFTMFAIFIISALFFSGCDFLFENDDNSNPDNKDPNNGGDCTYPDTEENNVLNGTYNLNTSSPNNAVIIAWNRPSGTLNYTVGSSTDLAVDPNTIATAVWANQSGVLSSEAGLGISCANGTNRR